MDVVCSIYELIKLFILRCKVSLLFDWPHMSDTEWVTTLNCSDALTGTRIFGFTGCRSCNGGHISRTHYVQACDRPLSECCSWRTIRQSSPLLPAVRFCLCRFGVVCVASISYYNIVYVFKKLSALSLTFHPPSPSAVTGVSRRVFAHHLIWTFFGGKFVNIKVGMLACHFHNFRSMWVVCSFVHICLLDVTSKEKPPERITAHFYGFILAHDVA